MYLSFFDTILQHLQLKYLKKRNFVLLEHKSSFRMIPLKY